MSKLVMDAWMPFRPSFVGSRKAFSLLREFAEVAALPASASDDDRDAVLEMALRRVLRKRVQCDRRDQKTLVASITALADLIKLGWAIRVSKTAIEISRPDMDSAVNDAAREFIRRQHHGQRDEQLRQPSVREFIRSIEARRPFGNQLVSIFSLMRDGAQLAEVLKKQRTASCGGHEPALSQVVQPYLQFVREDDRCETTGLRLVDIWRYFRHTWASPSKSVPGRSMMILIRDAAAPFHPVIGVAALSSAAVAVTVRDEWIGWTPANVMRCIEANPSPSQGRWLLETVDAAIKEIYKLDLIEDGLLTPGEVKRPSAELIARLQAEAKLQREKHFRLTQQGQYKKAAPTTGSTEEFWLEQTRLPLFRRKRTEELARLLGVRMVLHRHLTNRPTRQSLVRLLATGEGRDAIGKIVRKIKAERVGTAVADLTVCGAIPPYNEILGGKLVAMLMASPEVALEYQRRYGRSPSVIASSMAGCAVIRPAQLAFIGTTSLYGQRPSQYDRISFPSSLAGGGEKDAVRYTFLGRTRGMGTFQFGDATVKAFQELLRQSSNGLQVNSVFGEGVNPRLRKIRDALGELGLPEDELLEHGTPRLVYGVQLAHNMREYLLGLAKRLKYLLPQKSPDKVTESIAQWWLTRWVTNRIERDDVLDRLKQHALVHPIRHGARVILPMVDLDQQRLFEGP